MFVEKYFLPVIILCLAAGAPAYDIPADSIIVPAKVKTAFGERCEKMLLQTIRRARQEILVASYSFSRDEIAEALIDRHNAGVNVKVKIDQRQAKSKYCRDVTKQLRSANIETSLIAMHRYRSMHHKFIIVDKQYVLTGSYNFTNMATFDNWENLVWLDSKQIADRFRREWFRIRSKK